MGKRIVFALDSCTLIELRSLSVPKLLAIVGDARHLPLGIVLVSVVSVGVAQRVRFADHAHPLLNHFYAVFALLVSSVRDTSEGVVAVCGGLVSPCGLLVLLVVGSIPA